MNEASQTQVEAGPTDLALVIPAFRARFLRDTLASLAAQTDRRFQVYVADDGSPEDLRSIVETFAPDLSLTYHRFEDNRGVPRLVSHWHRAIRLSREPWVCLFSDDDQLAPGAVAAWRREAARFESENPPALWRWDVEYINADGESIGSEEEFPSWLPDTDYLRHVFGRPRVPCMIQNMIFRRDVYEREHGFTETHGGYCADICTWSRFAAQGGVRRVPGEGLRFRLHENSIGNLIGVGPGDRFEAIKAYGQVVRSIRKITTNDQTRPPAFWRMLELRWYCYWFRYQPRRLRAAERAEVSREMALLWPQWPWRRRIHFLLSHGRLWWRNLRATVARLLPSPASKPA